MKVIALSGAATVKVAEHTTLDWHPLVTVQVTVFDPPVVTLGAPAVWLSEMLALQPPLKLTVASHALYCASAADCDWHAPTSLFTAQFKTTAVAVT